MTKTIQIRVDEQLKTDAEELFSTLGLDLSTAVRMFFSAAIREQGVPFPIRRYNEETRRAIEGAMAGRNLYGPFDTVDGAIASMLSDGDKPVYTPKAGPANMVAEDAADEYKV